MPEAPKTPKRLVSHSRKAEQVGVSTKTIDRWCQSGILQPPTKINGRKFHDADDMPRNTSDGKAA